jgi:hypothetical protein
MESLRKIPCAQIRRFVAKMPRWKIGLGAIKADAIPHLEVVVWGPWEKLIACLLCEA